MRIQVRNNVFETNSSSTHSICISTKCTKVYPERIRITGEGEFGADDNQYLSYEDKANYLWAAIMYICGAGEYDENGEYNRLTDINVATKRLIEYKHKIESWLSEEGISHYLMMPKIELLDDQAGGVYFYLRPNTKNHSYIDHGEECGDMVEGIMSDKQLFLQYIFGQDSYIITGCTDDYSGEWKGNQPFKHTEYDIYFSK